MADVIVGADVRPPVRTSPRLPFAAWNPPFNRQTLEILAAPLIMDPVRAESLQCGSPG